MPLLLLHNFDTYLSTPFSSKTSLFLLISFKHCHENTLKVSISFTAPVFTLELFSGRRVVINDCVFALLGYKEQQV
ncbi:hypothetical protein FG071_11910 [Vibrio cholerae]|nr:hypothetical protein [Vibrio cholerae]